MKDALKDLWFYFLGFFIFMSAAPVIAWIFPRHDPHHQAMNGVASLCVFMGLVFLIMASAHTGKKIAPSDENKHD